MKRIDSPARNSFLLAALVALAALGASGCMAAGKGIAYGVSDHGPTEAEADLLKEEMAPYRHRGNSTITGQAFLETASGRIVAASGVQCHLVPATSYARRVYEQAVVQGNVIPKQNQEEVWWTEEADAAGRFKFTLLPAGSYLAFCPIAWAPQSGGDARIAVAYAEVRVAPGQQVEVNVQRQVSK